MKIKITIIGPRVHDVGYRVFLMKHAMNLALPGLSTYKWDENGPQEVIALVEGDEARIAAFRHCQRRFRSAQYRRDNSAQPYKYLCSSINADA
jgi:acylphosphatase